MDLPKIFNWKKAMTPPSKPESGKEKCETCNNERYRIITGALGRLRVPCPKCNYDFQYPVEKRVPSK